MSAAMTRPAAPMVALRLPDRPEDATAGELGLLAARHHQLLSEAEATAAEVARLESQLAGYRHTVEEATPDSDMNVVAAAECGIRVVERTLESRRRELGKKRDAADCSSREVHACWNRVSGVRRRLEAGGSRAHGACLAQLRALCGEEAVREYSG